MADGVNHHAGIWFFEGDNCAIVAAFKEGFAGGHIQSAFDFFFCTMAGIAMRLKDGLYFFFEEICPRLGRFCRKAIGIKDASKQRHQIKTSM